MEDNSAQDFDINKTLEDGAWLDSFDKILGPKPILREKNTLKRKVNASYNRDSSVENSINSKASESGLLQLQQSLNELHEQQQQKHDKESKSSTISTPVIKSGLKVDPFKCSLSPIGAWRLLYFNKEKANTKNGQLSVVNEDIGHLKCTPIKPIIEIVDYDESVSQTAIQNEQDNNDSGSILFRNIYKTKDVPGIATKTRNSNETKSGPRITNARHVCFKSTIDKTTRASLRKTLNKDVDIVDAIEELQKEVVQQRPTLQPGKWRKSFIAWRRQQDKRPSSLHKRQSENRNTSVEFVGYVGTIAGQRKSIFIKPERISENVQAPAERVLKRCNQKTPLQFEEVYSTDKMMYCVKIGEGAYGEVFLKAKSKRKLLDASSTVMKVIPIEGTIEVNGEKQKTYEEILSEVVISMELSNLRECVDQKNLTSGFVNVKQIVCVQGEYPAHLIKLWEEFDKEKCSENDHPDIFDETQIYIILQLEFCGRDMESFQFQNAEQAYYALMQIVLTLAVAESAYQFEHRDLHWGNVLLLNTHAKELSFTLNNHIYVVPTKGVKATLIDYTLSRMTFDNCCHYNDISCDEDLFTATGDYQFDIYRMMRDVLGNNWETFEPRTNVFWISYIITKMIDGVQYKNRRTKAHTIYHTKLQHLREIVLNYNSCVDFTKYLMDLV